MHNKNKNTKTNENTSFYSASSITSHSNININSSHINSAVSSTPNVTNSQLNVSKNPFDIDTSTSSPIIYVKKY